MKYLFALCICLLGCTEPAAPEPQAVLSGKIKEISFGSKTKWAFKYDAKTGTLASRTVQDLASKTEQIESYTRDSSGLLKSIKNNTTWLCSYKNGLLVQIAPEGSLPSRTEYGFRYTGGQWSSIVKNVYTAGAKNFSGFITLAWAEDNPSKLRNSLSPGVFEEEDYTYESRPNTLAAFFKKELGLICGPDFEAINPLYFSASLPKTQLLSFAGERYRYSYSYNALERLSAIYKEQQSPNGSWSRIEEIGILYY